MLSFRETALELNDPPEVRETDTSPEAREDNLTKILSASGAGVSWLIFLSFGSLLLTLYYQQINYFPELAWEEALTYLAAISVLGGGVTAIYALLLFIPGAIWSEFLIFDSKLRERLCYQGSNGREPCFKHISLTLGLPFLTLMILVHLAAASGSQTVTFVVSAVSAASALACFAWIFKEMRPPTLRLKYVMSASLSAWISLAALLILYSIASPSEHSPFMLSICTAVVVASNFLVAVQFRQRPARAITTGLLAAFLLLVCGEFVDGGRAALSARVMEEFGLGGESRRNLLTLVVAQEGRDAFAAQCVKTPPSFAKGKWAIQNARILSRLGSEYFLQVGECRVALPKEQVTSWSSSHR